MRKSGKLKRMFALTLVSLLVFGLIPSVSATPVAASGRLNLESDIHATGTNNGWIGHPASGSLTMDDTTHFTGISVSNSIGGGVTTTATGTYNISGLGVTRLEGTFGRVGSHTAAGDLTVTCADSGRFLGGANLASGVAASVNVSISIPSDVSRVHIRISNSGIFGAHNRVIGFGSAAFITGATPTPTPTPPPAQRFTITATASPAQGGIVTGGGIFNQGETVTLVATPNSGWRFDGWYSGNHRSGTVATMSFNAISDRTLQARFSQAAVEPSFITSSPLPNGRVGTAYNQSIMVSGTLPITVAVTAGSLPNGLSLNANTGAITGTPTVAGTFNFTVRATGPADLAQRQFSITIAAAPTPTPSPTPRPTPTPAPTPTPRPTATPAPTPSPTPAPTPTPSPTATPRPTATPAPTPAAIIQNPVSNWAREEVERAAELNLIPETLASPNVDLREPITRLEFAGVVVRTFESLAGTTALPITTDRFADTRHLDALKAYNLGLMIGVSDTDFAPDTLLDREQAATALTRSFKRATTPGWSIDTDHNHPLDFVRPAPFADDAYISDWAREGVYFMAANGIILGTGNNMFSPRAVTSAQQARGYAQATREQAIIIALRMVENLN